MVGQAGGELKGLADEGAVSEAGACMRTVGGEEWGEGVSAAVRGRGYAG